MRWPTIAALLIAACTHDADQVGNPLAGPFNGINTTLDTRVYSQQRAQVEVAVKSNFPAIKQYIRAGGGPSLTQAMDLAGIPLADRPARIIQLQSDMRLYENTPGALVTALMIYGA